MTKDEKEKQLAQIAQAAQACTKCDLYKQANKAVPGAGNPESEIVFIGEGPGYHEDQQGLPFVGMAGKLLDELLKSIDLTRERVWIGNMVKHRPPGNRDPLPEEIGACRGYLNRQIEIIDPRLIVTLGRFSMNYFLPEAKISQIHGQSRYVDFAGKRRIILPMYHPAAALRSTMIKQQLQEDFLKMKQYLDAAEEPLNSAESESNDEQMGLL